MTSSPLKYNAHEVLTYGSNFRVHGNGFIQIDMPNKDRVHVWGHHNIPRQSTATQIHDHRFTFTSAIQHGSLVNICYAQTQQSYQIGRRYFDVYSPSVRDREDTELHNVGEIELVDTAVDVYHAGEGYRTQMYDLHETMVNCPTITVMRKLEVDHSYLPRIMVTKGLKPDNDFTRYTASERLCRAITEEVFRYWGDNSFKPLDI